MEGNYQGENPGILISRSEKLKLYTCRMITILAIYIFGIQFLGTLKHGYDKSTTVTFPLTIVLLVLVLHYLATSKYPRTHFGITLSHSKNSLKLASLMVLILIAVSFIYKWLYLNLLTTNSSLTFIDPFYHISEDHWIVSLFIYTCIVAPLQALICYGGVQRPLRDLMHTRRGDHKIFSTIITALLFGVLHLWISFEMAVLAGIFSIFGSIVFIKYRTLTGPTLIHALFGAWAFFFIGFPWLFK